MERLSNAFELPRDVWLAIAIKVATTSIEDMCMFRRRFFERCIEIGHPELLFREALRELYIRRNHAIRWEMLQNTARNGLDAATYALSMELLIRKDDSDAKKEGMKLFRMLEAGHLLPACYSSCFAVLTISWPDEVQMLEKGEEHTVCDSTRCLTRGHMGLLYDYCRRAAERGSVHGVGGADHIRYIRCRADYEVERYVDIPRAFNTKRGDVSSIGPANLPYDVWTLITGRIAAQSVRDLCNLRMLCTAARNAGEEDFVYRYANIPIWDQRWWSVSPMHQPGRNFLARCRQSRHLEVLFRSAVSDLFLDGCRFAGIETIHVVAAQGHSAAQYTVSMMLMLRDDFESKNKSLQTFRRLEAAGALTICKLVFRGVIQGT
ncbi:hypothetical protein Ahy_A06g027958 [Arachis hypogaea]|uniref:At2g35280-like TPR domain-containing protein n=1 Tax=Arachis hypogaea TaxID=3818 RepID=A0A445CQC6_ARAHY|nr:hypothetical protein Ahy_A06g027958 [Arachis hypogaea]